MLGELVPVGGGDPVPLLKDNLIVGRRESCDIVLRFANVSSNHCKLECHGGYWYVRDLNSKNGTRVNGTKVSEKRLDPGDELRVAKHKYRVNYSPMDLGAVGPPPTASMPDDLMDKSLLERAGLKRGGDAPKKAPEDDRNPYAGRIDLLSEAGHGNPLRRK
ncbi:MAG: FHA domain-containing protein [Planctomycetota bacterium]